MKDLPDITTKSGPPASLLITSTIVILLGLLELVHAIEIYRTDPRSFPTGWNGDVRYSSQLMYLLVHGSLALLALLIGFLNLRRRSWTPISATLTLFLLVLHLLMIL